MDRNTQQRLQRAYIESRILSAHPIEVVAMLYQVAIESLKDAIEHLKSGDRFARARSVTRAEQSIHELLVSLDHSVNPPFTRTSANLYYYVLQRIVAGHAQQSQEAFEEALSLLQPLALAWAELKARIYEEPAMNTADPEERRVSEPAINDPYAAYRQSPGISATRDWSF